MQVKQAQANLPGKRPQIPFREVKALLQLVLDELLDIAALCKLNHNVYAVAFPVGTFQAVDAGIIRLRADTPDVIASPFIRKILLVLIPVGLIAALGGQLRAGRATASWLRRDGERAVSES